MYDYDVAIVGGGIAGLTAAKKALNNNLKVILFERNLLGGKAINGGDVYLNVIFKLLKNNKYENIENVFKDANLEIKKIMFDYTSFNYENIKVVNDACEILDNHHLLANNIKKIEVLLWYF